jgi:hypothetical protein
MANNQFTKPLHAEVSKHESLMFSLRYLRANAGSVHVVYTQPLLRKPHLKNCPSTPFHFYGPLQLPDQTINQLQAQGTGLGQIKSFRQAYAVIGYGKNHLSILPAQTDL